MLRKIFLDQIKYKRFRNNNYSNILKISRVTTVFINNTCNVHTKVKFDNGPTLKDFIANSVPKLDSNEVTVEEVPYLNTTDLRGDNLKVHFEVYGCQMNVSDAEIVWAVLQGAGYTKTTELQDADIVLLITCALREGAEGKIWDRIGSLASLRKSRMRSEYKLRPKVGILGCMAERLKEKIIEKERSVDLVAGPDSYKDLPRLLAVTKSHQKAVNVLLSLDETYADITPVRLNEDSVTSFVSIMRGCDNMCTYCIVPFTRGRERSRPLSSILDEVRYLSDCGVKEVTLLGQNVNSYRDTSQLSQSYEVKERRLAKGFKTVYKLRHGGIYFAELLDKVSDINPEMRIRFVSPHPKDFPDEVLEIIKSKPNICKSIHLPAQSGNSVILEKMRRGYTREAYLELVEKIKRYIPNIKLSSDFIVGFCGETDAQFQDTCSLIETVGYNFAYIFSYSMREKTTAYRKYVDNVPKEVKLERVRIVIDLFRRKAEEINKQEIDKDHLVLIEGDAKRSESQLCGKSESNRKIIISKSDVPEHVSSSNKKPIKPGDYVCIKIKDANAQTLKGVPLYHTTLQEYHATLPNERRI